MTKENNFRSRKFCLLLYPEDESHVACMERLKVGYKYLAILHDKDTWSPHDPLPDGVKAGDPKKPHWHVVLQFPNDRWQSAMAKELEIEPNYIQKCSSFDGACLYLVHDGLPEKYQYPLEECFGTLVDHLKKLLDGDTEDKRIVKLMNLIRSMGYIEYEDLIIKAAECGLYGDLRRMGYMATKVVDRHNAALDDGERQTNAGVMVRREAFNSFLEWTSAKMDNVEPM